ncbi:MAG: hypothetical protein K9K75_00290 [Deltaproteobacteria bacterium]|nr:hypothetical protein [Deltaproteobacteria bacterium]
MQHSEQPHIELAKARVAIDAMRSAKALDEFEENWKEFLGRLERVWNKAFSQFGKSPKWNGWKGRFEGPRKTDPLLAYLVNVRGADEHTVNEIVGREPGGIGINAAEGNSLYIERMEINNGRISIKSPQKIRVDFLPARTTLLPVVNRGRTYPIPTTHLGSPVDPMNVVSVAEAGAQFYQQFLAQAEEFFVK